MKNKETLEEYAERIAKVNGSDNWKEIMEGIIDGAKWQQEPKRFFNDDRVKTLEKSIEYLLKIQNKFYSEQEVGELLYNVMGTYARHHGIIIDGSKLDELFNEFKK